MILILIINEISIMIIITLKIQNKFFSNIENAQNNKFKILNKNKFKSNRIITKF